MTILRRLTQSRAARNMAASYFAFFSSSVCALLSIPVAVKFLEKEQIGLWVIVNMVIGYLLWMDMGVGDATGRKMADAIAQDDRAEINRWWTTSILVLATMGLLLVIVALGLCPLLPRLLSLSAAQSSDGLWLFLSAAIVAGLSLPSRAYPGILLAQERFHWVPLVQGIIPWIQFGIFYGLLAAGYGVKSYFWGLSISQFCGWSIWWWQVHGRGDLISLDFTGLTRERFRSLFGFSGSIAVHGISQSILQSLPSMVLARLGGLAIVPVYSFSLRGPSMISALSNRTIHSFYPNLQRLYVAGERNRFIGKFRSVIVLSVGISLVAAGGVLAGNRLLIQWLAGVDFYVGNWTNIWFAIGVIVAPLAETFVSLLQCSGSMGKMPLLSVAAIGVGIVTSIVGYHLAGLTGIAMVFALLPIVTIGPYALLRGSSNGGFRVMPLAGTGLLLACVGIGLVLLCGTWIAGYHATPVPLKLFGRMTSWPNWREIATGVFLGTLGAAIAIMALRKVRNI